MAQYGALAVATRSYHFARLTDQSGHKEAFAVLLMQSSQQAL
jgi:hypothetical protein